MSKRVAVYLRQSKTGEESISLVLQEQQCRSYASQMGWTVAGVYREAESTSASKTRLDRPALRDLRAAYGRGEFDLAVAHSVSRFSRHMADGAEIVGEMPLATVLEGEAPEGDDFVPLLHMLLAHKTRQEISRRWKETHQYRISRGMPSGGGRKPGYEITPEGYVPTPEGDILAEAYALYAAGNGWQTLVQYVNTQGARNKWNSIWKIDGLRKYLDHGFPAGYIWHNGTHYPGAHEAVISEEMWTLYQAARRERTRKNTRGQTATHALGGIVFCELCGKAATRTHSTKKDTGKMHVYLRCTTRRQGGMSACAGTVARMADVEKRLAWWLGARVEMWATEMPDNSAERGKAQVRVAAAQEALKAAEEVLSRLATGWASGLLDVDGYRLAQVDAIEKRQEAEQQVQQAEAELAATAPLAQDAFEAIERGGEGMSIPEWNAVLRRLLLPGGGIVLCTDGTIRMPA
jgi:site-specific DNA recombinase